ncbi:MAG TPA: type II CAAX endopeptidase family protein [Egibacteraceae bacterium]
MTLEPGSFGDFSTAPVPPPPALARVPWTIPQAVAVFALAFLGTLILTGAASMVVPSTYAVAASLVAFNVSLALTTLGFVALRHPGSVHLLFGSARPSWGDVGVGLVAGLGAYLLINVGFVLLLTTIANALGFEVPETQQGLREGVTDPTSGPFVIASAVLLAPLAEELFFRGMLFQAAARRLRLGGAAGVSAVAFALAHAEATGLATVIVFLGILPLGVLLAWLFARRGTLLVSMVVHATFNAVGAVGLLTLS